MHKPHRSTHIAHFVAVHSMPTQRPFVLSIAGFDPSGGAGVIADVKTFEQFKVMGQGVTTAITYQNDEMFEGADWLTSQQIERQIHLLCKRTSFAVAKIGLVQNMEILASIVDILLVYNPAIRIVWDPIVRASAGFVFHDSVDVQTLEPVLKKLFLITPNRPEMQSFFPALAPEEGAAHTSTLCNVLLKGGHDEQRRGYDTLFSNGTQRSFRPKVVVRFPKHGSGCTLSAGIAAALALGYPLHRACLLAKNYATRVLESNPTLLGYHKR